MEISHRFGKGKEGKGSKKERKKARQKMIFFSSIPTRREGKKKSQKKKDYYHPYLRLVQRGGGKEKKGGTRSLHRLSRKIEKRKESVSLSTTTTFILPLSLSSVRQAICNGEKKGLWEKKSSSHPRGEKKTKKEEGGRGEWSFVFCSITLYLDRSRVQ